ncbi:hypothetical protein [Actinomadura atramentaria]|uniref:hypothetical protein n=1 Tax=Actinomadura atramentaria TaxID=1990 RepID=UPI0012F8E60B|nr:hypothetical protein [Actinomadura atramentaria]
MGPRHDSAAVIFANYIKIFPLLMTPDGDGPVDISIGVPEFDPTGKKRNAIPGGSSENPGINYGYADVIVWGKNAVWVWEVRPRADKPSWRGRRSFKTT